MGFGGNEPPGMTRSVVFNRDGFGFGFAVLRVEFGDAGRGAAKGDGTIKAGPGAVCGLTPEVNASVRAGFAKLFARSCWREIFTDGLGDCERILLLDCPYVGEPSGLTVKSCSWSIRASDELTLSKIPIEPNG